ncbi:AcrR family transcriptional regulator [Leifsonia sp. AK011]|uniref:TetR/AcrR family transcriptional regulator n=1 Tax=Leifsonia sp. AK011 TaxID=2723075 RepID=UPI0015C9FBDF|nr:TetR/AcrR family transcriptional regulator [Leifsonia sp. AK011]NYF10079.1 AcrR family transcriptional regulator [Leifsonia sp. AK011]
MARTPDLSRKPELVEQILEYLLDKPLSSVTFRSLATGLGVSTFTLVYHFGTRADLIREVIQAISVRSGIVEGLNRDAEATLETFVEGLELSWEWSIQPRNRQLQRLEFEAGMLESLHPGDHGFMRDLYRHWVDIGRDAMIRFGMTPEDAEAEARVVVNSFHGLQYDLVLNDDVIAATRAFERALEQHRSRIEHFVGRR